MKALITTVVVVLVVSAGFAQDRSHDESLDGLVVVGEVSDGESTSMDTLSFIGCEMVSHNSSSKGFPKACYFIESIDGGYRFTVDMGNEEKGAMRWKGSIRDGKVEAVIVTTDQASGSTTEYEFVGAKYVREEED